MQVGYKSFIAAAEAGLEADMERQYALWLGPYGTVEANGAIYPEAKGYKTALQAIQVDRGILEARDPNWEKSVPFSYAAVRAANAGSDVIPKIDGLIYFPLPPPFVFRRKPDTLEFI